MNHIISELFKNEISTLAITPEEFCLGLKAGPLAKLSGLTKTELFKFKQFCSDCHLAPSQILDGYVYAKEDAKYGLGIFLTQIGISYCINNCRDFDGLAFTVAEDKRSVKASMRKKGVSHPIEVIEHQDDHMQQLKDAEHPVRRLRMIALQQVAELALGIKTALFCHRTGVPLPSPEPVPLKEIVVAEPGGNALPTSGVLLETEESLPRSQAELQQVQPMQIDPPSGMSQDELEKIVVMLAEQAIQLGNENAILDFLLNELKDRGANQTMLSLGKERYSEKLRELKAEKSVTQKSDSDQECYFEEEPLFFEEEQVLKPVVQS